MTISWTFHGSLISSDPGIMTTPIGGRGSNLIIMKVDSHHSGEYTCTATNEAGSRSESVKLTVNGMFYACVDGTGNIPPRHIKI